MKRYGRGPTRWLWRLILALALAAAAVAALYLTRGYRMYRQAVEQKSIEQAAAELRAAPDFTPLDQLPQTYLDAVIAVEDHRFYEHGGVDGIAICRAVWVDVTSLSFAEGGSTITQQLAKNLFFTQQKTFERKFAEVFAAFALERQLSKDEILELYVNSIYFGSGYYSIGAAAAGYFGKAPALLTAGECTVLAGLPNAPSAYAPGEDPTLALQRQRQVLRKMVKYGKLTQQQADAIAAEPVFGPTQS